METYTDQTQVTIPLTIQNMQVLQQKIYRQTKYVNRCTYLFLFTGMLLILSNNQQLFLPANDQATHVLSNIRLLPVLVIFFQLIIFAIGLYHYNGKRRLEQDIRSAHKLMLVTQVKRKRWLPGQKKFEVILMNKPKKVKRLILPEDDSPGWKSGDLLSLAYLPASGIILQYENLTNVVNTAIK